MASSVSDNAASRHRSHCRHCTLGTLVVVAALGAEGASASADPLRLRADAYAFGNGGNGGAGLLSLQGRDKFTPWLDAEAQIWLGAGDGSAGDVLIIAANARDLKGRASVRVGRQLVVSGALRPMHLDGVDAHVRAPAGIDVEAFAGFPVIAQSGPRQFDWLVGGRVSRRVWGGRLGLGAMESRDRGALDTREIGIDGSWPVTKRIDLTTAVVLDTIRFGLAETRASAMWSKRTLRLELFGVQRTAAHLLPATSLFSVLGDVPAVRTGGAARWRAAPRLDVTATAGVRIIDGEIAEDLIAGTRLRLNDSGSSAVGLELTREGGAGYAWTGARATGRYTFCPAWMASAEFELARPDDDRGRGKLWPWGLAAVTWRSESKWDAAMAVEASASPELRYRVDVLARLSRRWEAL